MVLEEDSLIKMVNERLRAQQRALRQPRRARPFDLRRGTVTRRTQQEAKRKGISPIFLQQKKEQEKARKEQIRKIREHYKKVLEGLKEAPSVLRQQIANIPLEHRELLPKDLIDVEKARKERFKKFDEKIASLERRKRQAKENDRDAKEDELREEARQLRRFRNREDITFREAYRFAKRKGAFERRRTRAIQKAREEAKRPKTVRVEKIKPQTRSTILRDYSPYKINTPGQLGGVLLTPQEASRRRTSRNSPQSESILNALKNIFGF